MKPHRQWIASALALSLLTTGQAFAEDDILDAKSGLERLKSLAGTWVNVEKTDDDSRGVEFSVTAAGSDWIAA